MSDSAVVVSGRVRLARNYYDPSPHWISRKTPSFAYPGRRKA